MADEGSCEAQTAFDLSAQRLGSKGWPHHASKILGQTLDSSRLTRWRQITPLESRENSIRLQISSKHLFAGLFDINGLGAKKLGIVFFHDRRRTQGKATGSQKNTRPTPHHKFHFSETICCSVLRDRCALPETNPSERHSIPQPSMPRVALEDGVDVSEARTCLDSR
jgi:hypothetical protein